MPLLSLDLSPSHAVVQSYYQTLTDYAGVGASHEQAVKTAFHDVLAHAGRTQGWTLVPEWTPHRKRIRVDGALRDAYGFTFGLWEAKDSDDDLDREVQRKFDRGYPRDNIIFQAPDRALLYQDGGLVLDADLTQPRGLLDVLALFFRYRAPQIEQFHDAVAEFKGRIPDLAQGLLDKIRTAETANSAFKQAFIAFVEVCREAVNPNIAEPAVEEMLIQHLLTERLFRTVFEHSDYRARYAGNLKRMLPRLPFAPDVRAFAEAGRRLADLHVGYEDAPAYPLEPIENPDAQLDWRVEKMQWEDGDKTTLRYNDFLTLGGIPPEAHRYRLGNRSALDWLVDQYRVKTDRRSGITHDPNRTSDDERYIVRLIKQVTHVSVETVRIVGALPPLGVEG